MRNRKEALSNAYDLSLEQVEWAYALSVTLTDFDSLSVDRQFSVLHTLCGPPVNVTIDGFSSLSDLWEETSTLSSETIHWLLQGLSQPEASQTFFACLEVFQQEDSEQAQLEAQKELYEQSTLFDESESDTDIEQEIEESTAWIPDQVEHGGLLLRIQDPLRNAYHYRTIDGSVDRTLYDLDREKRFLERWSEQNRHHNQPLAMLCLNWKTTPNAGHKKAIIGTYAKATLQIESTPNAFNHAINHQGSMRCSGGHRNTLHKGGIDLGNQTVQSDSQHLEHWSLELLVFRGSPTPMYWNLQNTVEQILGGLGNRGGFISLHSNVYVQIVDEHNQYLLGTTSTQTPISTSELSEHTLGFRRTSHINTWLADQPIDFSAHVVHNKATIEPIFKTTPPLDQQHSIKTNHQGFGYKLQGLFFAELGSKAWQKDTRQRVAFEFQNIVQSTVTGSIFWNGHQVDLLESGHLHWKNEDTQATVNWHLTQSRQTSTHKEVRLDDDDVDLVRIQHIQSTHQCAWSS